MAKFHTTPPQLTEKMAWVDFKKEIIIWRAFTDLPKEKQGPVFYLSLTGKAREAALEGTY